MELRVQVASAQMGDLAKSGNLGDNEYTSYTRSQWHSG